MIIAQGKIHSAKLLRIGARALAKSMFAQDMGIIKLGLVGSAFNRANSPTKLPTMGPLRTWQDMSMIMGKSVILDDLVAEVTRIYGKKRTLAICSSLLTHDDDPPSHQHSAKLQNKKRIPTFSSSPTDVNPPNHQPYHHHVLTPWHLYTSEHQDMIILAECYDTYVHWIHRVNVSVIGMLDKLGYGPAIDQLQDEESPPSIPAIPTKQGVGYNRFGFTNFTGAFVRSATATLPAVHVPAPIPIYSAKATYDKLLQQQTDNNTIANSNEQSAATTEFLISQGLQWTLTNRSVDSQEQLEQTQQHQRELLQAIESRRRQHGLKRSAGRDMTHAAFLQHRRHEEQRRLPTWAYFQPISSSSQREYNPQYPSQLGQATRKQPRHLQASVFSGRFPRQAKFSGNYGENLTYVAPCQEPGKQQGLIATRFIPSGTQIARYGRGVPISQREKDQQEQIHHHNNWFQTTAGQHPTFLDGTGSLGALVNHECGKHFYCLANSQIQRDGTKYWITSIKDIEEGEYLSMDYNFDPAEMQLDTDDQEWWRQYTCSVCHPLYARAFHMGVPGTNGGKRHRYRSKRDVETRQQRLAKYRWIPSNIKQQKELYRNHPRRGG